MAASNLPAIQWGVIAGILDHGGGRRVVFTSDLTSVAANTRFDKEEQYYLAPGWHRMTDIWSHKEWIIWQGEKAVLDGTRGGCGACRACCITLYVADEGDGFTKPSHTPCQHLCNAGCGIYEDRPRTCSAFRCVWLKSQSGNDPMAPELRPDRCGSILTDIESGPIRIHTGQHVREPSAALQAWVADRQAGGWVFDDVTHYTGERR